MKASHFFLFSSLIFSIISLFAGFPAGTLVLAPQGPIRIDQIHPADFVVGYSTSEQTFLPLKVKEVRSQLIQEVVAIITDQGTLYASADQLFYEYSTNDFIRAADIKIGAALVVVDGTVCRCYKTHYVNLKTVLYELTLEEPHLFFAGNPPVLVHNFVASAVPIVVPALETLAKAVIGYQEAQQDFDSLQPKDVKDIPTGRTGKLEDGRNVTVRTKSGDGRPTLEIFNSQNKRRIKVRYG